MLPVNHLKLSRYDRSARVKRLIDVSFTTIGGILLLPLIGLISLLIVVDSPGPAIFIQKRPGMNGKTFNIYKFRTMYVDAERRFRELPPQLLSEFQRYGKIKYDPRVTRVGRVLRRTSLDELPQMWNVLVGDMSLVGPRAYLFEQLPQMGVDKDVVLMMLPGITGVWQVSGRSSIPFSQRVKMDVEYVRNWSLRLDLTILIRTISVVLKGEGAY